jgi:hypothetical protein
MINYKKPNSVSAMPLRSLMVADEVAEDLTEGRFIV